MTIIAAIGENLALGKDNRSLRGRKPRRSRWNTSKLEDLDYIFDISKVSESELKDAFKGLFTAKKTEIFNNMKPELRSSLQLFSPDELTSTKIDQILDVIIKAE